MKTFASLSLMGVLVTALSLMGALVLSSTAFGTDAKPAPAAGTPSAEQQCRIERSAMGLELFRQIYGTNKTKRNAFGKCVSKRAHATSEAAKEAKQNASKACKAERKADPVAFAQKYGTNSNKRNAFGKCVSKLASADKGDKS